MDLYWSQNFVYVPCNAIIERSTVRMHFFFGKLQDQLTVPHETGTNINLKCSAWIVDLYWSQNFAYFPYAMRSSNELQFGSIFFCISQQIHQNFVLARFGTNIVHMYPNLAKSSLKLYFGTCNQIQRCKVKRNRCSNIHSIKLLSTVQFLLVIQEWPRKTKNTYCRYNSCHTN